jgi:RNA-binding protein YhbY
MVEVQIGKNGFTEGTMKSIELAFKTHDSVNIVMLKNSGHTKEIVSEIKDKILKKLGRKYTATSLGFTIKLRKWRREVRR